MNYQADYQRLLDLVDFAHVKGLFFISGDTHYAELPKKTDGIAYPLYDLTSSGLTLVWNYFGPNRLRFAQAPLAQNFGRITINWDRPDPEILMEVEMINGTIAIEQALQLSALQQG